MNCLICGNTIPEKKSFKPKLYCSENCRNYAKFKNALEKSLILIRPTSESKSIIRGDMFRLANLLSKSTVTKEREFNV